MTATEAHLLRYTRMPGEDGGTPRDLFVLITSTEVTLATLESAVAMIFDGGFEPELVLWLPMEKNTTVTLVKRAGGWFTIDGVTAVLTERGAHEHRHRAPHQPTREGGTSSGE